ncbi:MAG: YtxH domain-containing protein [Bacteroidota bacterium]|nr:YtxH domain-containing protein [Bacteroidota bacterium]
MKTFDNLSKTVKRFTDKHSPVLLIEEPNYFSIPFFMVGAAVGAIIALLFTPDTGENNRKKILEKFNTDQDEINFNGHSTYKIREVSEDGIKNLEQARENINQF